MGEPNLEVVALHTSDAHHVANEGDLLDLLREGWATVGAALFVGPSVPSRKQIVDAALRVQLLAMTRGGLTITAAAERCKTSRKAIRELMKRLGTYEPPSRVPRVRGAVDWSGETELGKVPDRVLAQRHDCSVTAVGRARRKLGIAAWRFA